MKIDDIVEECMHVKTWLWMVLLLLVSVTVYAQTPNDALVQELCVKSGLVKVVEQLPAIVQATIERARQEDDRARNLPDNIASIMKASAEEAFSPVRLKEVLFQELGKNLTVQDMKAVLDWLSSPLGKRWMQLEEAASVPEALAEMQQHPTRMRNSPPTALRLDILRKLDSATKTTETGVEIAVKTQGAVTVAMIATLPSEQQGRLEHITRELEKGRPRIEAAVRPQVLDSFLYTYRTLADDEIQQYVEFATSPAGSKYYSVTTAALKKALLDGATTWGKNIGEATRQLMSQSVPAPSRTQDSSGDDTPTFYRLVPGTYVNGFPRFTVHYPKDWEERPMNITIGDVFRVSRPGPHPSWPVLTLVVGSFPFSIDKFADLWAKGIKGQGYTNVSVVSNKPSRLRDGTPSREVEVKAVKGSGTENLMSLVVKKDEWYVITIAASLNGRISEDLKAILYSIEFQPGKDEPVKVPPDVQEFLDRMNSDIVSRDIAKVLSHYSESYLDSGMGKAETERIWRQNISHVTSSRAVVTDFVAEGDRAYFAGFVISNGQKSMLQESIIKENGEWKFYGNQRDVVR
jgi:hypothetical protein